MQFVGSEAVRHETYGPVTIDGANSTQRDQGVSFVGSKPNKGTVNLYRVNLQFPMAQHTETQEAPQETTPPVASSPHEPASTPAASVLRYNAAVSRQEESLMVTSPVQSSEARSSLSNPCLTKFCSPN